MERRHGSRLAAVADRDSASDHPAHLAAGWSARIAHRPRTWVTPAMPASPFSARMIADNEEQDMSKVRHLDHRAAAAALDTPTDLPDEAVRALANALNPLVAD